MNARLAVVLFVILVVVLRMLPVLNALKEQRDAFLERPPAPRGQLLIEAPLAKPRQLIELPPGTNRFVAPNDSVALN